MFKRFITWWAWSKKRNSVKPGFIQFGLFLLLIYLLYWPWLLFGEPFNESFYGEMTTNTEFAPVFHSMVSSIIILMIFFGVFIHNKARKYRSSQNWRIAIDEAETFLKENPRSSTHIGVRIRRTKETKDPEKLNECVENWTEFFKQEKRMQKLEERKKSIENGGLFTETNADIQVTEEALLKLEAELLF